jgi:hypothetical protein
MADPQNGSRRQTGDWRSGGATPPRPSSTSSAGVRLFLLTALLLITLGGAIAWLVVYVEHAEPVVFRSFAIREYAEPLPSTPFAAQDSAELAHCFSEQRAADNTVLSELLVLKALDELTVQNPGVVVVVHFCALARSDGSGVQVITANPGIGAPPGKVSLAKVLEAMRKCKAKHKLLLLDLARPLAEARLGILADDVAEQVQLELKRQDDKEPLGFFVFTACAGQAQVAQTSEELGSSIFAHYLARGLRGEADGWNAQGDRGDHDGSISVTELAEFVRAGVERWVRQNRGTRQTPTLWGDRAQDFSMLRYDKETLGQEAVTIKDVKYPDWLLTGWQLRDEWWMEDAFRIDPDSYRKMESILLRYEQRWRGGREEDQLKKDLAKELAPFTKLPEVPDPILPPSLFRDTEGRDKKGVRDLQRDLDTVLQHLVDKEEPADPDEKMSRAKLLKQTRAAFAELAKKDHPLAAWLVFDTAARQADLKVKLLKFLYGLVPADPERPTYVEIAVLGRLEARAKQNFDNSKAWSAEAARQALNAFRESQITSLRLEEDPLAMNFIADVLAEADDKRRQGEARLLTAQKSVEGSAAEALLAEAVMRYKQVEQRIKLIAELRRKYDALDALVPGWVELMSSRHCTDPPTSLWKAHASSTGKLADLLSSAEKKPLDATPRELAEAADNADDLRKWLAGKIDSSLNLNVAAGVSPADYRDIQALLDSALLSADQRRDLWTLGRAVAVKLHGLTDQKLRPANSDDTKLAAEYLRAGRRAQLSIDLLSLARNEHGDDLARELQEAARGTDTAAWRTLGAQLAAAWNDRRPRASPLEQWQKAVAAIERRGAKK